MEDESFDETTTSSEGSGSSDEDNTKDASCYECWYCKAFFKTDEAFYAHHEEQHKGEQSRSCTIYASIQNYLEKQSQIAAEKVEQEKEDALKDKKKEANVDSDNLCSSIDCEGCGKSFPRNTFLKHLTKAKKCKNNYTEKEMEELKLKAKSNNAARKRKWESENKKSISERKSKQYKEQKDQIMLRRKINDEKKKLSTAKKIHKNDIESYKKYCSAQSHRNNEKMWFLLEKTSVKRIDRLKNQLSKMKDDKVKSCTKDSMLLKLNSLESKVEETLKKYESLINETSLKVKDEKNDWNMIASNFSQIFDVFQCGKDFITTEWHKMKTFIDKELEIIENESNLRIKCKGCNRQILSYVLLNHLRKNDTCMKKYPESEKEKLYEESASKYYAYQKKWKAQYYKDNKKNIAIKNEKYYEQNKEKLAQQRAEKKKIQDEIRKKESLEGGLRETKRFYRKLCEDELNIWHNIHIREMQKVMKNVDSLSFEKVKNLTLNVQNKISDTMQQCENKFKAVFDTETNVPKTYEELQEQRKEFKTFWHKFYSKENDVWSSLDDSISKIENEIGYSMKCFHCASKSCVSDPWEWYDSERHEYLYENCNHKQHLKRKELIKK